MENRQVGGMPGEKETRRRRRRREEAPMPTHLSEFQPTKEDATAIATRVGAEDFANLNRVVGQVIMENHEASVPEHATHTCACA